jgi:hypothetical protein
MGRLVHVPAEDVGRGLSPGREGLSGLPNDEKPARNGFGEAGGIIHHLQWLHQLGLVDHVSVQEGEHSCR